MAFGNQSFYGFPALLQGVYCKTSFIKSTGFCLQTTLWVLYDA